MKLLFYSKLNPEINLNEFERMNSKLLELIGTTRCKVGYLASQKDPSRTYFSKALEFYLKIGIKDITYFDLENEYDDNYINRLFECDIIHLSSGNTYCFLKNLKNRNLLDKLKSYAKNDGIMVGFSAGGHILCKDISASKFGDNNTDNLQDLNSLGLVDFKVIPHWNKKKNKLEDIKLLSRKEKSTIYLIEDGCGIVIDNNQVYFYGEILKVSEK